MCIRRNNIGENEYSLKQNYLFECALNHALAWLFAPWSDFY